MNTWAKGVNMGQEFAVNNIIHFYDSESRFAIHDDPAAGMRSTLHNLEIVTSLVINQSQVG